MFEDRKNEIRKFTAIEIMRALIKEKMGEKAIGEGERQRNAEMKTFIRDQCGEEEITKVPFDKLKDACEGEGMVKRAKYRKQVQNAFSGVRPAV